MNKAYLKEKLLDWERKSLEGKFSIFSFAEKSTWLGLGMILFCLCVVGLIVPFIPPRYAGGNWLPASTGGEYKYRLMIFLIVVFSVIIGLFVYLTIRNKIDLILGTKWTANFKITRVFNLGTIKVIFMNGWRPFIIKARQPYFTSATKGQIITIKRTGTFRLIDYFIRDEKVFLAS